MFSISFSPFFFFHFIAFGSNQVICSNFVQHQLELSPKHQAALVDADLTSANGLADAIVAAQELQAVMNAEIHPSMVQLTAVQEQKKRFDKWKSKFSHILSRHLNNQFIHIVSFI